MPDLKAKREQAGVSLAQMQERTGIDKGHLSRLENGANPTLETVIRYAAAIDCDVLVTVAAR